MSKVLEARRDLGAGRGRRVKVAHLDPDAPKQGRTGRMSRLHKVDFTRPTKFTVDHQRRIRRAMDSFAQACALRLSNELHVVRSSFEMLNTVQLTWAAAQAPDAPGDRWRPPLRDATRWTP